MSVVRTLLGVAGIGFLLLVAPQPFGIVAVRSNLIDEAEELVDQLFPIVAVLALEDAYPADTKSIQ